MYLGDDLTDEDALKVLAGGLGIGILVAATASPPTHVSASGMWAR